MLGIQLVVRPPRGPTKQPAGSPAALGSSAY